MRPLTKFKILGYKFGTARNNLLQMGMHAIRFNGTLEFVKSNAAIFLFSNRTDLFSDTVMGLWNRFKYNTTT